MPKERRQTSGEKRQERRLALPLRAGAELRWGFRGTVGVSQHSKHSIAGAEHATTLLTRRRRGVVVDGTKLNNKLGERLALISGVHRHPGCLL